MKLKKYAAIIALLILYAPAKLRAQKMDGGKLFNDNWKFHSGDTAINKTLWRTVELPHDWSIEGPFSEEWASATGYLPGGIGWYKKSFSADASWQSKKVSIYFDGVYKNSEVWINGHYLGKRPNGFIPFEYDLTPYINYNKPNSIIVKADHSEFADSRWYTGSGIYRNVYLIVKDSVNIHPWDVAFSTPDVTAEKAIIKVNAEVNNTLKAPARVSVKINLLNAKGVAATKTISVNARPGKNAIVFSQQLQSPQLWSVDHPQLYRLQLQVMRNGKVVNEVNQMVGIRSIRFDKDNGFFLNGANMKLKGVCIHDDAGALGVAVPREVWERRLAILKEGGVNSLRLSHNPHAGYLYDLCDKMGFLVMDEAFDEWEIGKNKWVKGWNVGTPSKDGYHEYFKEWAHRDLADMVKRSRNHPSIILWSIGNEIDYPNDPYTHEVLNTGRNPQMYGKGYLPDHPSAAALKTIAKDLVKVVKEVDRTRPVTAALAGVVMSNEVGYPEELDVVGYNYQEYRYAEDHKKYSNRIIYGSENGMAKKAWNAVDSNKYISAQYLWTGIDYLGEAGKWPQRSNGAGLLDLAGFKKPEYFYRQSLWAAKPMVYVAARELKQNQDNGIWSHRSVQPTWNWDAGAKLRIECFTNCQAAELFLNGKSLGKQLRDTANNQMPAWNVDYQAGELLVKGYNDGKQVSAFVLKTAGEPSAIAATADHLAFSGPGKHLSQVEIQVTDKNGIPVYSADNEINVEVSGNARLLGLESGSTSSHESYQSPKRKALHGKLLAYIETNGKPGDVQVSISSAGIRPALIKLKTK
ncbi:sugar-binding domain-containing protein [Mucilaginibacter sp. KACC 22063]|uniref:sugar-binding domain-containing protein n=1 Tax=Mucilaginibacter sp. KACC 22063 TaxID=3025666 RepID=UPI00236511B6|nr:sugar-binding domain-containing protein [Mucilaginibacter sp. KACC 22063]WDF56142.1 glycoside hydrolase family 2 TIM barrel-domain containing protein [Mucilaginibacter sp. KACC 22063]